MSISDRALALQPLWRVLAPSDAEVALPTSMAGIPLRNPVGLAAGLDKRCQFLGSVGDLGFGYVVGGTVTAHSRSGNAQPRVLRIVETESAINALGFPGDGLDAAVKRLQRLRHRPAKVLISTAALEEQETLYCMMRLEEVCDGVELNISSPNTEGLRRFHNPESLKNLLDLLNQSRSKPLFVKIPPFRSDSERDNILALVRICRTAGVDGVTAANTIPVEDERLAVGRGGLSGRAILENMLNMIPDVRAELGAGIVVNACGGIASAGDARLALEAGADTVQLYTALLYQGPGLVAQICEDLQRRPPEPRS